MEPVNALPTKTVTERRVRNQSMETSELLVSKQKLQGDGAEGNQQSRRREFLSSQRRWISV